MDVLNKFEKIHFISDDKKFNDAYLIAEKLNDNRNYYKSCIVKEVPCKNRDITKLFDGNKINIFGFFLNVVNGDVSFNSVDSKIKTLNGNLEVRRYYDVSNKNKSVFGIGYKWNFDFSIKYSANKIIFFTPKDKLEFVLNNQVFENKNNSSLSKVSKCDTAKKEITICHDDKFYIFNFDGYLRKISDKNNNFFKISYIPETTLIEVIESNCNKNLKFYYKDDMVAKIEDNIGRAWQYFYKDDYLEYIHYPNGAKEKFFYSDDNKIEKILDENNFPIFKAEYDRYSKLTQISKNKKESYLVSYDKFSKECTLALCDEKAIYKHDRTQLITNIRVYSNENLNINKTFEYDAGGKLINRCSENFADEKSTIKTFTYDDKNRIIYKSDSETDKETETIEYFYDDNDRLFKEIKSSGCEKIINYDKRGNVIETKELINKGFSVQKFFTYDSQGRLSEEIDGNKNSIIYKYDSDELLFPSEIIFDNFNKIYFEYDKVNRLLLKKIGSYTIKHLYSNNDLIIKNIFADDCEDFILYDTKNFPREIYSPLNIKNSGNLGRYKYVYDYENNLMNVVGFQMLKTDTDDASSLNDVTETDYVGNKVLEYKYLKTDENRKLYKLYKYEYDKNLNLIKKTEGCESVELNESPQSYIQYTYKYDNRNNLTEEHSNSGSHTKYFYSDIDLLHKMSVRIAENVKKVVHYEYSNRRLLSKQTEILEFQDALPKLANPDVSFVKLITSFFYNENDVLMKIALPNKQTKTYDGEVSIENINVQNVNEEDINIDVQNFIRNEFIKNIEDNILCDKFGRIIKISSDEDSYIFEYDFADNIKILKINDDKYGFIFNSINQIKSVEKNEINIKNYLYDDKADFAEVDYGKGC